MQKHAQRTPFCFFEITKVKLYQQGHTKKRSFFANNSLQEKTNQFFKHSALAIPGRHLFVCFLSYASHWKGNRSAPVDHLEAPGARILCFVKTTFGLETGVAKRNLCSGTQKPLKFRMGFINHMTCGSKYVRRSLPLFLAMYVNTSMKFHGCWWI